MPLHPEVLDVCHEVHRSATLDMGDLEFVHISSAQVDGGNTPITVTADRRRIRSQAMKDFRRKERQRRTSRHVVNGRLPGLEPKDTVNGIERKRSILTELLPPLLPSTVSAPPIWRHSLGSRMAEAWFPAGHRGSALRNIAYTYDMVNSASIVSIQDALSLLHAGSAARIDSLLLEARKRYVPVIALLRREVGKKTPEVPVLRLGFLAMACLMCEVIMNLSPDIGIAFHKVDRRLFKHEITRQSD
jgi:hypothetical protein